MAITIHGAGCALMDYLYRGVDFTANEVQRLLERSPGDGGLTIGGLVFAEALEAYAGTSMATIIRLLAGDRPPDRENVGGPAIVSLIHTAQLCRNVDVRFFGAVGNDGAGRSLRSIVGTTPLDTTALAVHDGRTAATWVFSDPNYADGNGERLFVNLLGVAASLDPADLGPSFPRADIVQLGGTALVPRLHDAAPELLRSARDHGALTVVNTVYDFRAQSQAPDRRWTIGDETAYRFIDLLIADAEEARRLTGCEDMDAALAWLLARGLGAAVITNGPKPVRLAARGGRFARIEQTARPVFTAYASRPEVRAAAGDTTGCGDTFAGGLVAGIARQMETAGAKGAPIDLDAAARLAIASGAFCLTHLGGTYTEEQPGEKLEKIAEVLRGYERAQDGGR